MNNPRPCWYKTVFNEQWRGGKFHAWSTCFEELSHGVGQYPVAIVEDDSNGIVADVPVSLVCFAATPPE